MPQNSNRPSGLSLRENIATSGGEQFWMNVSALGPPIQFVISFARLSSGAEFPGITGYESQNSILGTWTNGALNYVWFRISAVGTAPYYGIESDIGGFPDEPDVVPLWIVDLNGAGVLNKLVDARPWFDGGAGGGANSVDERLKEILQHSVMQNYRYSWLPANQEPDISQIAGQSTGTYVKPSEYLLANTQKLTSRFTTSALEAPSNIEQVTVAVLADQLLSPGNLTIEVSRDGGTTYETVSANFTNHVFGAVPTGNNLQIRITNVSGGNITIIGYGMYYNNIGGPTGVINAQSGIVQDSSGLNFYNTNPSAYRVSAMNFAFTWTCNGGGVPGAGTGILSWNKAQPTPPVTGLQIEITDPISGTFIQTLAAPGDTQTTFSIADVAAGGYLYFDVDRSSPNVTLKYSVGPPLMIRDRFILGKRLTNPGSSTNDVFVLWNNHLLPEVTQTTGGNLIQYPPLAFNNNQSNAIYGANAPTAANPFATIADLSGIGFTPVHRGANVSAYPSGPYSFTFNSGTRLIRADITSDTGDQAFVIIDVIANTYSCAGIMITGTVNNAAIPVSTFGVMLNFMLQMTAGAGAWSLGALSWSGTVFNYWCGINSGATARILWSSYA